MLVVCTLWRVELKICYAKSKSFSPKWCYRSSVSRSNSIILIVQHSALNFVLIIHFLCQLIRSCGSYLHCDHFCSLVYSHTMVSLMKWWSVYLSFTIFVGNLCSLSIMLLFCCPVLQHMFWWNFGPVHTGKILILYYLIQFKVLLFFDKLEQISASMKLRKICWFFVKSWYIKL